MTGQRRQTASALVVAAIASVVAHLPLAYVAARLFAQGATADQDASHRYVSVTPLGRDTDSDEPTEREREQDERYDPDERMPEGQVVDAPAAGEIRRPEGARFLSDRNQTVSRQTQARLRVRGPASIAPLPQGPAEVDGETLRPYQRPSPMLAGLLVPDRRLPRDEAGEYRAREAPPDAVPSPLELRPTLAAMSDAIQGTGLDDLGDIDEGDQNLLSTARWRHAPFFQRVKHQVEQYWHPGVAFMRHDPTGHLYGYRDRETVIRVVLDSSGRLERAYVISPSGADFLDEEAVGAIRQASPFPNPPRALVDPDTQQIVFTFGFVVEVGERPVFRVRRYGDAL